MGLVTEPADMRILTSKNNEEGFESPICFLP